LLNYHPSNNIGITSQNKENQYVPSIISFKVSMWQTKLLSHKQASPRAWHQHPLWPLFPSCSFLIKVIIAINCSYPIWLLSNLLHRIWNTYFWTIITSTTSVVSNIWSPSLHIVHVTHIKYLSKNKKSKGIDTTI